MLFHDSSTLAKTLCDCISAEPSSRPLHDVVEMLVIEKKLGICAGRRPSP